MKIPKWVLATDKKKQTTTTYQVIQSLGDSLICWEMTQSLKGKVVTLTEYEDITELVEEFDLKVGDRVYHIKDQDWLGQIIYIDFNLIADDQGVSTCLVLWDGGDIGDIQWTNKLVAIEDDAG